MLKLRQAQIDAVVAARWEDFFARSLRHVRETMTEFTSALSDADLRRLFDSSAARGRQFGLQSEREILCVFESSILLGDRFEHRRTQSWAMDVLQSRYLAADERATLLLATARNMRPAASAAIAKASAAAGADVTIAVADRSRAAGRGAAPSAADRTVAMRDASKSPLGQPQRPGPGDG